jgi:hypothetical protein
LPEQHQYYHQSPFSGIIQKSKWPAYFLDISAEDVRVREDGLYIKMSSFFASEEGLFIPKSGFSPNLERGLDPSYELLGNQVYKYEIKG